MAANKGGLQLNLVLGKTTTPLDLPLDASLSCLQREVENVTGVPTGQQRLICRGKKLTGVDATLSDLGVSHQCKILMIGVPAAAAAETKRLGETITSVEHEVPVKEVGKLQSEIRGAVKGFLGEKETVDVLRRHDKKRAVLSEAIMRLMLQLDEIPGSSMVNQVRQRRKSVIEMCEGQLRILDDVQREITRALDNEFGEMDARRGNV